jgi:hypothetical protein
LRRSATISVALPPAEALRLFTPVGERDWVPGWDPDFPAGESGDGAEPGTVFVTTADERRTIWVALDRGPDHVRYAQVIPEIRAGTVEVRLTPDGPGTSAEVTYELTALSDEGAGELAEFEASFGESVGRWAGLIARRGT